MWSEEAGWLIFINTYIYKEMGIMKYIKKDKNFTFDLESVIERLLKPADMKRECGVKKRVKVTELEIEVMCEMVSNILIGQPMLLELEAPVNVCGDIHGQFDDLKKLFSVGGYPPFRNYLFLGDYVDRGKKSVETLLLLMAFKIKFPENFFVVRGNHESDDVNKSYGFYDECKRKYSAKTWRNFNDVFRCLPVAAVVAGKIFCCHGGISPDLKSLDQIRHIGRPCGVPPEGVMSDLMWADPGETDGFVPNKIRGHSFTFGTRQLEEFLEKFDLDLLVRGHEVEDSGFRLFAGGKGVTVFSAPNYCGRRGNYGAIMIVDEDLKRRFKLFESDVNTK